MELKDKGGRVGDVTGTIVYNGIKHAVKGRRFGARCAFGILSMEYGKPEGCGYVEWAPTGRRAQAMKDGEETQIDRIFVGMNLPDLPFAGDEIMNRG